MANAKGYDQKALLFGDRTLAIKLCGFHLLLGIHIA
jgi:hypothetical protein